MRKFSVARPHMNLAICSGVNVERNPSSAVSVQSLCINTPSLIPGRVGGGRIGHSKGELGTLEGLDGTNGGGSCKLAAWQKQRRQDKTQVTGVVKSFHTSFWMATKKAA